MFTNADYCFNGLDTTFSKNLIEFHNFVFESRFNFVTLVVSFMYNDQVSLACHRRKNETIFCY